MEIIHKEVNEVVTAAGVDCDTLHIARAGATLETFARMLNVYIQIARDMGLSYVDVFATWKELSVVKEALDVPYEVIYEDEDGAGLLFAVKD